eukprot:Skav229448  [mRNA]  locus=scaffold397:241724:250952:+ [translate_table: standard]
MRHYEDPVCPSDCLKCSSRGECLHCTNSKYLDPVKSSCEDICPDGYFPGGTGRQNDYYLYDGACHQKEFCPMGTWPRLQPLGSFRKLSHVELGTRYHQEVAKILQDTDSTQTFKLCNLSMPCCNRLRIRRGEELEDESGNFVGGNCSDCPQNCLSCSSPTRCTTCKSSTYLTPEMSCEERCPPGYYGRGTGEIGRTFAIESHRMGVSYERMLARLLGHQAIGKRLEEFASRARRIVIGVWAVAASSLDCNVVVTLTV